MTKKKGLLASLSLLMLGTSASAADLNVRIINLTNKLTNINDPNALDPVACG